MKNLSSQELLSRTRDLVTEERRITLALIEHLEEISRRMLYAEMGYSSMWDFTTRELGLSEGAAQRRLQAMRLVRDVPEAKVSIENGTLSLSNAAKVQSFRQAEKKLGRKPDAHELVAQVGSLSQRECEAKLFELSPQAMPRERERVVSSQQEHELKIVVSAELYEKLQRIRGLAKPDASYAELLELMADEMLTKIEKNKGITHDAHTPSTAAAAVIRALPSGKRVYLPAPLKRAVWARSGGKCQYPRCSSQHRLEIDHIQPLALSGPNSLENLRVLCWHHNRLEALRKLGNDVT